MTRIRFNNTPALRIDTKIAPWILLYIWNKDPHDAIFKIESSPNAKDVVNILIDPLNFAAAVANTKSRNHRLIEEAGFLDTYLAASMLIDNSVRVRRINDFMGDIRLAKDPRITLSTQRDLIVHPIPQQPESNIYTQFHMLETVVRKTFGIILSDCANLGSSIILLDGHAESINDF